MAITIIFSILFISFVVLCASLLSDKAIKVISVVVVGALAVALILPLHGALADEACFYPKTVIVVELDEENDMVITEDAVGFIWEFYGVEDFEVGDMVSLLMFDCGTELIFDDEVIDAVFSGYTVQF